MYISKYEIARNISDYQLELLIYLKMGYTIVTNEGSNFRAWLEKDGVEMKGIAIRKDSADKLLSWELIELVDGRSSSRYYYKNSLKSEDILSILKVPKIEGIKWRASNKLKKLKGINNG